MAHAAKHAIAGIVQVAAAIDHALCMHSDQHLFQKPSAGLGCLTPAQAGDAFWGGSQRRLHWYCPTGLAAYSGCDPAGKVASAESHKCSCKVKSPFFPPCFFFFCLIQSRVASARHHLETTGMRVQGGYDRNCVFACVFEMIESESTEQGVAFSLRHTKAVTCFCA